MADHPFLPFAVTDYLADTRHLSDEEHGRYVLMLFEMWITPRCRLPNNDEWLARKFKRSIERVRCELRPLIDEFCQSDGNWITQKRLSTEKDFVTQTRRARSDSAKSRWRKEKSVYRAHASYFTSSKKNPHESESESVAAREAELSPAAQPARGAKTGPLKQATRTVRRAMPPPGSNGAHGPGVDRAADPADVARQIAELGVDPATVEPPPPPVLAAATAPAMPSTTERLAAAATRARARLLNGGG